MTARSSDSSMTKEGTIGMMDDDDKHGIRTVGEELYLVHLRRLLHEEDDHDSFPRKRRSSSVGEELWEVHRRRSQGVEDDSDRDTEEAHTIIINNNNMDKKDHSKCSMMTTKKPEASKYRYNLRSRDSLIKKA
mmetsp:Transcript_16903/g.35008  ORF Transcript_16903/g.35008 Transcript_16903/m.35008 type:complete len:133 (+) Transcript_16903:206-604(+)